MEKEIRTQALAKTDSNTVEGYALNWNEYDMGAFVERIDPNALGDLQRTTFTRCITTTTTRY